MSFSFWGGGPNGSYGASAQLRLTGKGGRFARSRGGLNFGTFLKLAVIAIEESADREIFVQIRPVQAKRRDFHMTQLVVLPLVPKFAQINGFKTRTPS